MGEELGIEHVEGGLEGGVEAGDFVFGAAKGAGGGGAAGDAAEGGAQAGEGAVFEEPFLGDGAVEEGGEGGGVGCEVGLDGGEAGAGELAQGQGGVARPVASEEEVAGDIEEDAAPAAPRGGEGGAGGAEDGVGIGIGVDGAVQADARGEIGIEGGDVQPAEVVGEEIAGGDAGREAFGEVQMGEEVHGAGATFHPFEAKIQPNRQAGG